MSIISKYPLPVVYNDCIAVGRKRFCQPDDAGVGRYYRRPCRGREIHDEIEAPNCHNSGFFIMLVVCPLFYILCFVWLFYAHINVGLCYDQSTILYVTEMCKALRGCTVPAVGTVKDYFLFRLIVYGISPITVIFTSFTSHHHQIHLLQRLTGLPAEIKDEPLPGMPRKLRGPCPACASISKNRWIDFTAIIVLIVNVGLGATTIVFDIFFLDHLRIIKASPDLADQACSRALQNDDIDGSKLSPDSQNLRPTVADTPIPIVVFNFFYFLWGCFYCLAVCLHGRDFDEDQNEEMLSAMEGFTDLESATARAKNAVRDHTSNIFNFAENFGITLHHHHDKDKGKTRHYDAHHDEEYDHNDGKADQYSAPSRAAANSQHSRPESTPPTYWPGPYPAGPIMWPWPPQ